MSEIEKLKEEQQRLQESLQAAIAKQREEEAKERNKKFQEERAARNRDHYKRMHGHFLEIQKELLAIGVTVEIETHKDEAIADCSFSIAPYFKIPGAVRCEVEVGAVKVIYRDSKSRFPAKGDGSFNYKAVAKAVAERIAAETAVKEREQRQKNARESSDALANKLREKHGIKQYGGSPSISGNDRDGEKVTISVSFFADEEKAERIIEAIKALL